MNIIAKNQQQGSILVMVLLLLLIMMLLAISIASTTSSYTMSVNSTLMKNQAFQAAESGADTLLARMNANPSLVNTYRNTLCSGIYSAQITIAEDFGNHAEDTRKLNLGWYACAPVRGDNTLVEPEDCPANTECFSLVITGVACPAEITSITNDTRNECVISRHLQGYQSSH